MKFISIALLGISLIQPIVAQNNQRFAPGVDNVSASRLMETVTRLASPEFMGRLSGSEGFNKAASYAAGKFRDLDLKPLNDSNYYQRVNVDYVDLIEPPQLSIIDENGNRKECVLGKDFLYTGYSDSGTVTAPAIFCGYGLSEPDQGYDDFAGIDLHGKIVLAIDEPPPWKEGTLDRQTMSNRKSIARYNGALGFVAVRSADKPFLENYSVWPLYSQDKFPSAVINRSVCEQMFKKARLSFSEVKEKIDSSREPYSFSFDAKIEMHIVGKQRHDKASMNVVGLLEGSDPELKKEYIIVGAHLDAWGGQTQEAYMPGAVDNASGCAAVIEIATLLSKISIKLNRSILFVFFTAEESGSAGAQFIIDNSPVPLKNIAAIINLDCMGCSDQIYLSGSLDSNQVIDKSHSTWNCHPVFTVEEPRGDSEPFAKVDIPTLSIESSCGAGYHKTRDKPSLINAEILARTTQFCYNVVYKIASGEITIGQSVKTNKNHHDH